MSDLRSKIIRLAHQNPELRPHLLPLVVKTAVSQEVKIIAAALLDDNGHARWPFGIDKAEAVLSLLGIRYNDYYEEPRGKFDSAGRSMVPLGRDVARKLRAIDAALVSTAGGYRIPGDTRPSSNTRLMAGFRGQNNYPTLSGPNAGDWALLFRAIEHSDVGLQTAMELAEKKGVAPKGFDAVDMTPSSRGDEGRRWTF